MVAADRPFVPRMQSDAHGFTVNGELQWRGWGGVVADVWDVSCDDHAHGSYVSPDARLFVILEMTPLGAFELVATDSGERVRHDRPGSMSFIPAGVAVAGRAIDLKSLRHLDIHLPEATLMRHFGTLVDPGVWRTTRLDLAGDADLDPGRVATLAQLIAAECTSDGPLADSYGEGLTTALLTALFRVARPQRKSRPSLSRGQLAESLEYMEQHCFEPIRLHDLASRLGLSESYFSHAFKASTGIPPLRWHMEARIAKVKAMISDGGMSLTQIAMVAGFSDQPHLSRVFKRVVGMTPAEWRRVSALQAE